MVVGFESGRVESAPAEWLAGFSNLVKCLTFGFSEADGFLRPQIRAHNFEQSEASAADLGHEPLTEHPAQGVRHAGADLLLLFGLKHAQYAVDSLAGVIRVQGAK